MSALDDLLRKRYGVVSQRQDRGAVEKTPESQPRPKIPATTYISGGAPAVNESDANTPAVPSPATEASEPSDSTYTRLDVPITMAGGVMNVMADHFAPHISLQTDIAEAPSGHLGAGDEQPPRQRVTLEDAAKAFSGSDHSAIPKQFKPEWEIDAFPWPDVCRQAHGQVKEAFAKTFANISQSCDQHHSNTIVLTSAREGMGRTTLSLCIAREAARQGKKVAILDLDHNRPTMLHQVGIEFEQGIESLWEQAVTAESICVRAVEDGVSLFPTVNPFNLEFCANPELKKLVHIASEHHDLVVIDASREVANFMVELSGLPRVAVIMVDAPQSREATQAFLDWLQEKQTWTLGVIENFAA